MEEEEADDSEFYRHLKQQLFIEGDLEGADGSETLPTSTTETSEFDADAEGETSTDDYICTCPWLDEIAREPSESEGGGTIASPTPSDLLYDELVHRNYVCTDIEGPSSDDSRLTPDRVGGGINYMVPFKIRWSFGFAIKSMLINLTRVDRKEFYIATAHKGNIFNYETNSMRYVHGHIKPVKAVSVDRTGTWLVTGGYGENSKVIVTDTIKCKQLLILNNPPGDLGSLLLGMAPDARYFFSVHYPEAPVIKIWKWTYGADKPDSEYRITKTHIGKPCRIVFHPNDQNFFMIAFEKIIMLAHWNGDDNQVEDVVYVNATRKMGIMTDCEMAMNRHEVYACTSTGYIAIFGNVLFTENIREHPLNTNKMYVKKIKVTRTSIKTMRCPDNVICILDENGILKFFDTNILLLYWIESELPTIQVISFSLEHIKSVKSKMDMKLAASPSNQQPFTDEDAEEEDRSLDYEMLLKKGVRSRASLLQRPFIVRDFIVGCKDGRIFHVDIVKDIYQPYFSIADSAVASLSVSTVRSLLYVAYQSGRVTIFDYDSLQCVITSTALVQKPRRRRINVHEEEEITVLNSFILISNMDIHLVVARTNGALIFLSPDLRPIREQRYKFTTTNIERMAFSENNQFLAFCDSGKTMNVLRYYEESWYMYMKFRGHTEPITDILFLHFENPRLYTIGEDRYIVEYSLEEEDKEMPLKNRTKIEDTAIPLCFLYYPSPPNDEKYFFVANSEYKFKLIHEKTMKCRSLTVGPHHGCYETPVSRMKVLPNSNGKFIIFQNSTHMGILKTPSDGNPYKHIGILANPKLGTIGICNQGKYVFTYAKGEGGILVWNVNTTSLDTLHYMGGPELEPYHVLIEGGANGWFFKEIEDLFCYIQILHQEDAYASQAFGDRIFIDDLPDLIRACGFYPSEYEVEQLIYEIQYKDYEKTGELRDSISFIEFVKLFLNHRPASGVSTEELEHHFNILLNGKDELSPHEFAKKMCKLGEPFTPESLTTCLDNLMSNEDMKYDEDILDQLQPINFEYFTKTMLGILQESAYTEAQERAIREDSENDLS